MEKQIKIRITATDAGKPVKSILTGMGLSTTIIRRLKRSDDGIMLNGRKAYTNATVHEGDELVITICDEPSETIVPKDIPLDILYEDEDIIAVNKPRDMPTHPSMKHYEDSLANAVMYYFRNENFTFRVVTRLDRDTSGVVLIAKNHPTAQKLNDDIKNQKVKKEYIAVVNGVPAPPRGRICVPIRRLEKSVILRCVAADGKEAITDYTTEKKMNGLSLVRLYPLTGRTHQLRVHLSYIGVPIYGDDLYGAPQVGEKTRLHCAKISFTHPASGEKIVIEAPTPNDMEKLI